MICLRTVPSSVLLTVWAKTKPGAAIPNNSPAKTILDRTIRAFVVQEDMEKEDLFTVFYRLIGRETSVLFRIFGQNGVDGASHVEAPTGQPRSQTISCRRISRIHVNGDYQSHAPVVGIAATGNHVLAEAHGAVCGVLVIESVSLRQILLRTRRVNSDRAAENKSQASRQKKPRITLPWGSGNRRVSPLKPGG